LSEYLHAIKTKHIEFGEYVSVYECYHHRGSSERDQKIDKYLEIGNLYYETKDISLMTPLEYFDAKKNYISTTPNDLFFNHDFKRWAWTWSQDDTDKSKWEHWSESNIIKFETSPLLGRTDDFKHSFNFSESEL